MAQIDRLLPALFAQSGAELKLASGHGPLLEVAGRSAQITPRVLQPEHVRFLIGEIVDAVSLHQLEQQGGLDFVYGPSGFPHVIVSVRNWHVDQVQARLRPYASDALPAMTPAS